MTFSIVARDPKTQALGVAVATAVPAVGSVVPHVQLDVAAIATQAQTSTFYGTEGLRLISKGLSPHDALKRMLIKDKDREKRQVIIIDVQGRTAAFTGKETESYRGHHIGRDCVAAGNMLQASGVVIAMTQAFAKERANLAERLLAALEAGQQAGGDKRGLLSAALKVGDRRWKESSRPMLDLRVDAHLEAVEEMRRVYAVSSGYFHVSE